MEKYSNTIFYAQSLKACFARVLPEHTKTGKALKDVVGKHYEQHRKRIYQHLGFSIAKEKLDNCFDADWIVRDKNGKVVVVEEDKGHYVDSCFCERAIIGFAKVANHYLEQHQECPFLVLSCPTRYKFFERKFKETLRLFRPELSVVLKDKVKYFNVANHDRLPAKHWIRHVENPIPFTPEVKTNVYDEIAFLQSLGPSER